MYKSKCTTNYFQHKLNVGKKSEWSIKIKIKLIKLCNSRLKIL